jgi:hypothetical protein
VAQTQAKEIEMNDLWLQRIAWGAGAFAIGIIIISAILLFLAPVPSSLTWSGLIVTVFVTLGAPFLGVIIVRRQPRNRIGWLWIVYGLAVGLRSLGHGIYYFSGAQSTGYSALEYFLLWLTEPTNLATIACLILLMLWFPDGQLPSRRWRLIYIWFFLVLAVLFSSNFVSGPDWNGGAKAGGIAIDNPYGWLPADSPPFVHLGFPSFISLLLITILSAVSLIFRYRSAGTTVRMQLRWFVLGGFFTVILFFLPIPTISPNLFNTKLSYLLVLVGQTYMIPLYLAVGLAILRYHLYDIDVIIRRTLQYTILSGVLALIYFGSVILLQSLTENLFGEQSPLVIVLSTLAIAALFNPLRTRIQDFIDRRFYRKKYNAEQALAQFAATSRDEVDMDQLNAALLRVVEETVQPESVSLWLQQRNQS